MKIKYLTASVLLTAWPLLAWPASAPEQLRKFVSEVPAATGQFTQQAMSPQGSSKAPQSGEFSFQRPGKFKWAVKKPYEQLILSDGKRVFQYDPDLAQLTERNVDQSIGASPAAILFGSGSLDEAFNISERPRSDGLDWLRAMPRSADAGFTHVDIGFKDNLPARLELLDAFGQTTRIDLSNMVVNPQLSTDEFKFTPPAGVDVVKMQ